MSWHRLCMDMHDLHASVKACRLSQCDYHMTAVCNFQKTSQGRQHLPTSTHVIDQLQHILLHANAVHDQHRLRGAQKPATFSLQVQNAAAGERRQANWKCGRLLVCDGSCMPAAHATYVLVVCADSLPRLQTIADGM